MEMRTEFFSPPYLPFLTCADGDWNTFSTLRLHFNYFGSLLGIGVLRMVHFANLVIGTLRSQVPKLS